MSAALGMAVARDFKVLDLASLRNSMWSHIACGGSCGMALLCVCGEPAGMLLDKQPTGPVSGLTAGCACWLSARCCMPVACSTEWVRAREFAEQRLMAQGRKNHCVAVIGDGAITGGMAYEAMNHAGFLDKNMIVVLNDNQQVRPVGCGA